MRSWCAAAWLVPPRNACLAALLLHAQALGRIKKNAAYFKVNYLAVMLAKQTRLSQHAVSDITGVSRDTIRKYTNDTPAARKTALRRKADA